MSTFTLFVEDGIEIMTVFSLLSDLVIDHFKETASEKEKEVGIVTKGMLDTKSNMDYRVEYSYHTNTLYVAFNRDKVN